MFNDDETEDEEKKIQRRTEQMKALRMEHQGRG
jgi:hypothetical protein